MSQHSRYIHFCCNLSQLTVLDDGVLRAVDATHRVAVMSAPRTSAYNVADHQTQRGITKKIYQPDNNAQCEDEPRPSRTGPRRRACAPPSPLRAGTAVVREPGRRRHEARRGAVRDCGGSIFTGERLHSGIDARLLSLRVRVTQHVLKVEIGIGTISHLVTRALFGSFNSR